MMRDNKHYKAEKVDGFWVFIIKDPGDYVGKHRYDDGGPHGNQWPVYMGCGTCVSNLSDPPVKVWSGRDRYWTQPQV